MPEPSDPKTRSLEIEGHQVEIRSSEGGMELRIDGVRHRVYQTKAGYSLQADAYRPPVPKLEDAVRAYLQGEARS